MVGRGAIEVAKTVIEVADVAFTAVECCHHHHDQHHGNVDRNDTPSSEKEEVDQELEALRSENDRLRKLLEQNLKLLRNISESPPLLQDCPHDLHARLMDTVESPKFLNQLESLRHTSVDGIGHRFPSKDALGTDPQSDEILINVNLEEPSWWVWVTGEMAPSNVEERSWIDDENYIVLSDEQVVDGVANFMARCILSNPKAQNLNPEDMRKALTKALGGMNKFEKMLDVWHAGQMFYALSTWGLALAGLYKTRAVVRLAAVGVHTTSKFVMKAL